MTLDNVQFVQPWSTIDQPQTIQWTTNGPAMTIAIDHEETGHAKLAIDQQLTIETHWLHALTILPQTNQCTYQCTSN